MIILHKKRILILSSFLFLCLFTCAITNLKPNNTVPTVSLPITNKVIVIDAGHGTPDEGAVSTKGTTEAQINLKIALKVQNLLEQSGATVILTRSDENSICDLNSKTLREKKVSDIKNRVEIGNKSSAEIFVSIHINKIPKEKYSGWQSFFREGDPESIKLAQAIQNSLNNSIQNEQSRTSLKLDNIYIMKKVEIPITLVECGFLSNPEDEEKILTDQYQDKLAWGIYTGIIDYFMNK